MPLKRVLLDVADEVSPLAAAVGSGNTLIFGESGRFADNTDVAGILVSLREAGVIAPSSAAILGAGGTAQAALAALHELGVRDPYILVRNASRTKDVQATADRLGMGITIADGLLERPLPDVELVISTLPGDAAKPVTASSWPIGATLLDVVYSPWPTALAAHARQSGSIAIGGLAVLLHQAVAHVEMMTGHQAPVEVMRTALEEASGIQGIGRP
jgi:shikimate dehydrogenase